MTNIIFAPAATADIDQIWDFTADQWNADQADYYTDIIRDTCYDLAQGSKIGLKTDVRKGYSKFPVGRHLIFFRHFDEEIEIIRILHQSMDFNRHL